MFRLDQHCKSLIASLSAFGGVATFVEEKFQDGIHIFVKVEICFFLKNKAIPHRLDVGYAPSFPPIKGGSPSIINHTFSHHLRLFVVLPRSFLSIYFLPQFLRKLICDLKFVILFISGSCLLAPEDVGYCQTS